MAKKTTIIPKDRNIINMPLEEAMPDNYLPYAIEVARDRALPDIRDGLKPVHRRILYGAYILKALPDKPYYKSARIVGDILGKFHPHGDSSVYDAMVILAQNFSTNHTLIEGHGNWGSLDGDSAAAMRYTEARLSPIAMEMLRDIDKNTVDMVDNYSNSEIEPKVLPARYPNLLVNGAFGIAVGLATNIPPHNLKEVIDATIALIDNPELDTKGLMEYVKGPDLPTGGELIGKQSMLSAYETGVGKVVLRAKTAIETLDNGRLGIVIKEFPYRQNKSKILQSISDMTGDKAHSKILEPIVDIRDESDRTGVRAVIEFKKSTTKETVEKVLMYLLKKTSLQVNISFNMVAIADGKPETLGLKSMLVHYINHQKDVILRRTKKELEDAERRYHIVEGFMKAMSIMDGVIETIRGSKSKQDSINNLVSKYEFSDIQSESIVTLMLYRLTNLELNAFEKEYKELTKLIKKLKGIIDKENLLLKVLQQELTEIRDKYGVDRRTLIIKDDNKAKIDDINILVDEDVYITQSNEGFIKRISFKSYIRSNANVEDIEYREGDFNKYLYKSNTKDTILFFTKNGFMYQTKCINLPEVKWKEKGERLNDIIKTMDLENDEILSVVSVSNFNEDKYVIFVTEKGNIKKIPLNKFETNYTKIVSTKVKNDDSIIFIDVIDNTAESKDYCVNLITNGGFDFNKSISSVEEKDRNILPIPFVSIAPNDKIVEVRPCNNAEEEHEIVITNLDSDYKEEFYIGYSTDFIVKKDIKKLNEQYNFKATSDDRIFAVTDTGMVLNISLELLSKANSVDFKTLIDEKIVSMMFIKNNDIENLGLFMFTEDGVVKKLRVTDFINDVYSLGYKFKDNEKILCASIGDLENSDIFLFSEKNMTLRFKSNTFTASGKVAGGVNAMRLKDDKVIFAITMDDNNVFDVVINNEKYNISDIEYKNKGTKGVELPLNIEKIKSCN